MARKSSSGARNLYDSRDRGVRSGSAAISEHFRFQKFAQASELQLFFSNLNMLIAIAGCLTEWRIAVSQVNSFWLCCGDTRNIMLV